MTHSRQTAIPPEDILYQPPLPANGMPEERVLTWGKEGELNRRIVEKLKASCAAFDEAGIAWTFGREQEFTLQPGKGFGGDALRASKIKELAPLLIKKVAADGANEQAQKAYATTLEKMPLQDIFMTDLHLRLQKSLEPRFAKSFYDPQGVLEVSTVPADPVNDVRQWHALCRTMQDMAAEYGYSIAYYKRDITFQATDKSTGKSLFQTQSAADDDARGIHMAEGILRVLHDATPCFVKKKQITDHLNSDRIDMGYGRHHAIRSRDGRLEMRTNHNPVAGSHPALENLLILSGAQYGLSRHRTPDYGKTIAPCAYGDKTLFSGNSGKLFFLEELLNSLPVGPEHSVSVPSTRLLMKYRPYLEKEMHLKEDAELSSWLRKIHVTPEGIAWPPAEDIARDPTSLRRELAKIHYGEQVRRLKSMGYVMDLNIEHTADPERDRQEIMRSAIGLMQQSDILPSMLGKALGNDIVSAFARQYDIPARASGRRIGS